MEQNKRQNRPERAAHDEPELARYATLGDYLRVVRRHRILVALIAVGLAGVALGISLLQTPTYRTSAQLSFQDPLQDVDLVTSGGGGASSEPPAVRAARKAELVKNPAVIRRVARELDASPTALGGSVSTSMEVQTNLVNVTAEASEAEFAAELANAYASQVQRFAEREELRALDQAEQSLEDELERARRSDSETPFRISLLEAQLSRTRTLAAIAEPAEVVRFAGVPGAPISPDTARNTILGAVLGLILGLLVAFVRDSLDRRMHSAQEVHKELGMPVLGRVGYASLGRPGLIGNESAPMLDSQFEAFRMLRTNLASLSEGQPVRSVLVSSPLPQEGKSTVSMSLASAAALSGQRVLLVECDLRRPLFAQRLGVNGSPGLSDYLDGRAKPGEILQVVQLAEPTRGESGSGSARTSTPSQSLVCISAGSAVSQPAELLATSRFADFMEKVARAYDLVVVDSPPLLSVVDALEVVPHVDCVLVCIRVDQTTREQARAAHVALHHVVSRPMGAVVTGIRAGDPDAYDYYYGY